MNIERAYKLHGLGINTDTNLSNIIEYMENIFNDLKPYKFKKFGRYKYFFNSNDVCILEFYKPPQKHNILAMNDNIWNMLKDKYLLDFSQITDLLSFFILKIFKIKIHRTTHYSDYHFNYITKQYKNELIKSL